MRPGQGQQERRDQPDEPTTRHAPPERLPEVPAQQVRREDGQDAGREDHQAAGLDLRTDQQERRRHQVGEQAADVGRVADQRQATLAGEAQPEHDLERLVREPRHDHEVVRADNSRHDQQHRDGGDFNGDGSAVASQTEREA